MAPNILPATQEHLSEVQQQPTLPLNEKLLEDLQTQLSGENTDRASTAALINQLSEVLRTLQQDPTPVVKLIRTIIRPRTFTFSDVLSIQPTVDFVAGLTSPSSIINIVTLELLAKAAYTASDAAIVAGQPGVMMALVQLWLRTPDTAVAQKALEVIWDLLKVDHQDQNHVQLGGTINGNKERGDGQGLVWRRLFGDRDIYEQIFSICSLRTAGQANQPSKRHKTVAQARLMDLIPRVAKCDWDTVSTTRFHDIESKFGVKNGGLMEFAALHMVDIADDLLMHVTLIDFFTELIGVYSSNDLPLSTSTSPLLPLPDSSPTLEFLIRHGLHQRTVSYYLDPSKHDFFSIEVTYIYSKAANYLASYATCYANHLLESSPPIGDHLLSRISQALDISPNQWVRGTDVQYDLHVLASLPRTILIPSSGGPTSAILKVPVKPVNPAALRTLATIFHGPVNSKLEDSTTDLRPHTSAHRHEPTSPHSEAASARILYFYYLKHHPDFWSRIVTTADIVALKDNALAAIGLLSAVVTAVWAPLPTQPVTNDTTPGGPVAETTRRFLLPTEQQAQDILGTPADSLPPSGILAILNSPTIDVVLPYLLRPAQTFSNLVGGRGDVESAAYKIAAAKNDLLTLFYHHLKSVSGSVDGLQDVETAIKRRLVEGPLAGSSEVGGRIGTLEL